MKLKSKSNFFTSGLTVVISLALVLFMLGALGLLVINASTLVTHFKEDVGFQIYLKDTATNAQTELLIQEVSSAKFAKIVTYITKEQAAGKLKQDLGEDFISFLGVNPLLNSIDIKLNSAYANSDTLKNVEKIIMQKPFVKEVFYQRDLVDALNKNTKAIAMFILIFSGALLIVAIALINNTIRLSIFSQRFIIRTMYLVGATKLFISKPFVFKGIRQGVIAGILAAALLTALFILLIRFIPELLAMQNENILIILFFAIILLGIIISALSALLSVRKYLSLKTSDLYN
ncbi:MAG: hypothetical protein JSU07_03490 [Bacteroidetes bacterium]|nr:hypothetical protein [Bacteroidota bacterium]